MTKSYVPQLVRVLRRLRIYINKHRPTMAPYLSTSQNAALDSILTATAAFDGVVTQEAP